MELNLKERQKLTRLTAKKYQMASKRQKSTILDTFISQTAYQRKYAIHILANEGKLKSLRGKSRLKAAHGSKQKRVYTRVSDDAVRDALILIWDAFSFLCGKLLAPFIRANLSHLRSVPKFAFSPEVHAKLLTVSPATIDRLLKKAKEKHRLKGTSGTRPAARHIKALIPVMTHFECKTQHSGLWQIDLVQHDGGNPSGEFCFTLTITDVKTSWTVHYPLRNKAFRWLFQALNDACSVLPLPIRILHSDNGSEFINHALAAWCTQQGIQLTRSRSNKKNDNCFVEQKNGNTVRKIVGYARFSADKGLAALQAVYTSYDKLLNFFYPCQKLLSKKRIGAKVKKTYDQARTPFERALQEGALSASVKENLSALKARTNLIAEREALQSALDKLPALADPVPEFIIKRTLKPLCFGSHG
jgi:transposase InsO family protein